MRNQIAVPTTTPSTSATCANTDGAIAAGVFGVPTLKVRDELFWGFDATELALAYRDDENALDAEMRRVDAIPEAVQRKMPA